VFDVYADENLGQSGRDLHVLLGQSEPHLSAAFVHPGEAVPWRINQEGLLILNMMKMQKLGGTWTLSHSRYFSLCFFEMAVEDGVDKRRFARI
jgi:hypothetical protein